MRTLSSWDTLEMGLLSSSCCRFQAAGYHAVPRGIWRLKLRLVVVGQYVSWLPYCSFPFFFLFSLCPSFRI